MTQTTQFGLAQSLYAALRVPHLAAQAVLRLSPHLAAAPVAIVEGVRPNERLHSANPAALSLGLRPGMSRIEVESFGAIHIFPRSLTQEQEASQTLSEALTRFTPRAEMCPALNPDWESLLDLAGTTRLLGPPETLGPAILAHLRTLGFTANLAFSANADSARSLARAHLSAVAIAPPGHEPETLAPLPLTVLHLSPDDQERFESWGIRTLGELAALPEPDLITRLGQPGRRLLLPRARELPHLLQPAKPTLNIAESLEFEDPIETLEPLLFSIEPLLEQLIDRAKTHALALAALTLTLTLDPGHDRNLTQPILLVSRKLAAQEPAPLVEPTPLPRPAVVPSIPRPRLRPTNLHNEEQLLAERIQHYGRLPVVSPKTATLIQAAIAPIPAPACLAPVTWPLAQAPAPDPIHTRTIRPAIPTLNGTLLLKMLQLDLESHPPAGAVLRLHLSVEPGDTSQVQLGLFAPPSPEPTRFEDTHSRLVAMVGETNVGRLLPLDTHAPEAWTLQRFKLPTPLTHAPPPRPQSSHPATALRRLRPSAPVTVTLAGPRTIHTFYFESRRYRVERCYGPWRSSGEWWQPTRWSTDAWDLVARAQPDRENPEGELLLCVLTHDLMRRQWQLEGIYD